MKVAAVSDTAADFAGAVGEVAFDVEVAVVARML